MAAVSFSKESCEHSSEAFQKAQTGGGVNTRVGTHCLLAPQHWSFLGKWHCSHPIQPLLHLNNHRIHHSSPSKLVMKRENTKDREQLTEVKDLKECWGTMKQNKPKPSHTAGKLLEGWTTKSFSKTTDYSSTENKWSDKIQLFVTWRHLAINSPYDRHCAKHCLQHYHKR